MRTMTAGAWLAVVLLLSGCSAVGPTPTVEVTPPTGGESMPGPAWVWLTTSPAAPDKPVPVDVMRAGDPAILYSYTFPAGAAVQGSFFTAEGRYTLSAMGGACSLPVDLAADDEAQVVLTIGAGGCSLAVLWQGPKSDKARPSHDPGVSLGAGSGY